MLSSIKRTSNLKNEACDQLLFICLILYLSFGGLFFSFPFYFFYNFFNGGTLSVGSSCFYLQDCFRQGLSGKITPNLSNCPGSAPEAEKLPPLPLIPIYRHKYYRSGQLFPEPHFRSRACATVSKIKSIFALNSDRVVA